MAAVIVAGYVVGVVPLVLTLRDLARVHPHLWTGFGRPHPWRQAVWISYLLAGWPVFLVALAWWTSPHRAQMRRVWRRSERRRRRDRGEQAEPPVPDGS